jgi:hypothetical protein
LWLEADPDTVLPVHELRGQGVLALDELAGVFAVQALRRNAPAVDFDVEQAVPLAAPVGGAKHERLVADGGIEFEESAGPGITARLEAV